MSKTLIFAAVVLMAAPTMACPDTGPPIALTERGCEGRQITVAAGSQNPDLFDFVQISAPSAAPAPAVHVDPGDGLNNTKSDKCNCGTNMMASGTGDIDVGEHALTDVTTRYGLWSDLKSNFNYEQCGISSSGSFDSDHQYQQSITSSMTSGPAEMSSNLRVKWWWTKAPRPVPRT